MDNLFTNSKFDWSIRMRRDAPERFFEKQSQENSILTEKNHWLDNAPELCIARSPSGQKLIEETWELAKNWGHVSENGDRSIESLGRQWEADCIFLDTEDFTIAGGCVCFPSSWNLQESTGKTLDEVHGLVPGLTEKLGSKIERFLKRIPEGQTFLRENWGLTRTADLNYHPKLGRARLDDSVSMSEVFLRIEHQAFVRIPSGVLLGVRIEPINLHTLITDFPETASRLRSQLQTMPQEVAVYKSLDSGIERVTELLKTIPKMEG